MRRAVGSHARDTPLLPAEELSSAVGRPVYLKAECLQVTGSFKVRGSAARLEALSEEERRRGIVACSSGNHGKAVAFVAGRLGIPATVFVPEWVDPVKLDGIRSAGAEARAEGETFDESEARALALAAETGRAYVSAYDDPYVIRGQGSIAAEIVDALGRPPAAVLAPLSGGGLIGGIAMTFDALDGPRPHIVAVSARNAAVMLASLHAGKPVELPEEDTLANALAGGIGLDNRHSFELVRHRVDAHVEVSEADIARAMLYGLERLRLVVEGGGAVALAAVLADHWRPDPTLPDGPVVIVVSGGNVSSETLLGLSEDRP
ncbi:MAG: pyridoxal-phosphate dependent enzyme [Gemmatimonadota bacterium]